MDGPKILIIEDENIVAKDIESTLVKLGYSVLGILSTGEDAIKEAPILQPDLVLMDIRLKGDMDGVEAASQIRSRFNIPVVYLTAYKDEKTLKRAKISEPYAYILKPFDTKELQIGIEMALYKHKMEEKLRRHNEELEELVKQRTERIQELERQRTEIEKLAAKGRMAAYIAHEINNPLCGIKNSFFLIRDAVPKEHKHYHYLGRIEKEIERLVMIVRQTFDLYKSHYQNLQEFEIVDVVNTVMNMLRGNCSKKNVKLLLESSVESATISSSKGLLQQVLYNIIQNAIDASPKEGEVKAIINFDGDNFSVKVSDQGSGIPDELILKIFEPFFTTKGDDPSGGLGLGLSISKNIVETMGGTLNFVNNEEGNGTVFTIELPTHVISKEEKEI